MARAQWPLMYDRPVIEIVLTFALGGPKVTRMLLADTGAGNAQAPFQILLEENDFLLCGGAVVRMVSIGSAYNGPHLLYLIPIEIPLLGFQGDVPALGVPTLPSALDGIAGFRFLSRFMPPRNSISRV